MRNSFHTLVFSWLFLGLCACAKEQNYRGVPEHLWQHLSGEQRQLIIDKAYQEEIQQQNKSVGGKP